MKRVLLLMPATSYRAVDFLDAARRLGVQVMVGSNHRPVLQHFAHGRALALRFAPIDTAVRQIYAEARRYPISAVIGTDEETTLLAAAASKALGLAHNSVESVTAAHDKFRFRCVLERAGLRSPRFKLVSLLQDMAAAAASTEYPCVLKPRSLCASRGVIRVDSEAEFVAAARRIAAILQAARNSGEPTDPGWLLVESYIPGQEVAIEGLLDGGRLKVLALFDKPDPLVGPFFEETIYVTPSRLPYEKQHVLITETQAAARQLGLKEGPVHAELRLNEQGSWMIEIAARSIGGLCSRTLNFAQGRRLEELILRHAIGLQVPDPAPATLAAGVMMIPIPGAGRLRAVQGLVAARSVPCIEQVIISIAVGDELVPLPEGDRYLGFIFARAQTPALAETALRAAHNQLEFIIDDSKLMVGASSPRPPAIPGPWTPLTTR